MRGSKVAIRQPLLKNGLGNLPMQRQPLRLFVFLVPSQVEPAQALKNRIDGGVGVALNIGVVEPQYHRPSIMTGVEPVEDESAGTAHMQKTRRRRRESDAKHNV